MKTQQSPADGLRVAKIGHHPSMRASTEAGRQSRMARSACDGWAAKRACEDQTLLIGRLADLIDDRKDAAEPLRCWVPACGQGEVAYEVAIMLAEAFGVDAYRRRFKIFATDANLEDQARARAGRLSQTTFQDSLAAAYVDQDGDGIKIKHAIRELMLFAEHDLCRDPPISRLDLIRCDHVFPDLDRSMKARLITLFHYTLNRGGYLWLDHTDSVDGLDDNFEILDARLPLLRRKGNERHFTSNLFPFGGLAKELEARRARKADTQHQLECDVEELRTLTEELQASFEETTAANEELSVLNQELLARSDVLRVGNERLEASEARYRSVVEDQSEYICRYQPDGTITFANGALCAALGLGRHQITGRNFADLWPGSTHPPSRLAVLSPEEPRQSRDFEIVSADGHACWQHWSDRAFFDRDGDVIEYQSVGKDITDRVAAEQQNQYLADHDQLTGLANRRGFFERAKEALAAARTASQQVAVHYLDLDQFKEINDGLGHAVGDALLLSVSHRLRVATRSNDTVARLGGDEFAVVQTGLDGIDDVVALANRLLASVRTYHDVADHRLRISVTIGIALFPNDGIDAETLLDIADLAMYEGKRLGGNRFGFFTRSLNEQVTERYQLRTELCEAFSDGQFRVHYQPIVNLKTHRICAIEALLRWQHPTRGLLCAAEFIDVLETISEIKSIGLWVLETACRQAKAWLSNADETMRLNVNLSGCMLKQPDLTGSIQATLEDTGFDPAMLELEITEHAVIGAGLSEAAARLCKLRDLGIQIALDDFGTGYSSLTFLRALPVGHIKIDRSFVAGLTSSAEDHAIVDAVIDLGRSLSLDVTAEGVEDREVLACLQSKQCDRAQGYLYGAAMTVDAIADLIGAGADLRRRTA